MREILTGLDVLLSESLAPLKNARVGLVTNPTGVTRTLESNIDVLRAAGIKLVALFSPEHGLASAASAGEHVASGRDERTGLLVHSLYGETHKPTPEMLAGIDALLFDLQDVGARYYTYNASLGLAMEACAENQKQLIVLDRPNPINGVTIEGPTLDPALQSFVGHGPLPIRYALTLGELAQFYNRELSLGADLRVIPLRGWKREQWYDETDLIWVSPSPNIPQLATTVVYPGMCLVEGTNLSEGRGTPLPFEIAGAPFVDGYALAETLNARNIAGARFRPVAFTPTTSKFANQQCFGVQVHVTARELFHPVAGALEVIATVRKMYPDDFAWRETHFDRLMGDASVRGKIDAGVSVQLMISEWIPAQEKFRRARERYKLYEESMR